MTEKKEVKWTRREMLTEVALVGILLTMLLMWAWFLFWN